MVDERDLDRVASTCAPNAEPAVGGGLRLRESVTESGQLSNLWHVFDERLVDYLAFSASHFLVF